MKRLSVIATLTLSLLMCHGLQSKAQTWVEVFSDDFTGSSLDESIWNIEVNGDGGGNGELQYYQRPNVTVSNGNLVLTAKRESAGGRSYTSGRVNTQGKFYFKHGKIEARIKMPKTANGLWPAFWMMGNDYPVLGWPQCGETDIVEMGHADGISSGKQDRTLNGAFHWGPSYDQKGDYGPNIALDFSLQDDNYHTYVYEWNESQGQMSVDGVTYCTMSIGDKSSQMSPGYFFHKDNFIIFNVAVGGIFPQTSNITALDGGSQSMYIDYVKVYQAEGSRHFVNKKTGENVKEDESGDIEDDETTQLGTYGSLSLDDDGNSTFDFSTITEYIPVSVSEQVYAKMSGKIKADYNCTGESGTHPFYVWENSYVDGEQSAATNSFGYNEGYSSYLVGGKGWSGMGYAITNKNLSMMDGLSDDYFLHISFRGTDADDHFSQGISVGNAKFTIGKSPAATGYTVLGDYKRDGRWCSFDIPVKLLKDLSDPVFTGADNFIAFTSGGLGGTSIEFDNIFFYKDPAREVVIPTTDTTTELGRYGYAAMDGGTSAFDFTDGFDYVVVDISDGVRAQMNGNIKADYQVGAGTNVLNIWEKTYSDGEKDGANSYGEDGAYQSFVVNSVGWSGLGYALNGQDLSMLDDSYYLHFSMKGTDILKHASHCIKVGEGKFTIGSSIIESAAIIGDYRRDGDWYSFDIPMTVIKATAGGTLFKESDGGASAYRGNVISMLSGGAAGSELKYDNIFFFKKHSDEGKTEGLGDYTTLSLSSGVSTFDFSNAKDIVIIDVDEVTKTTSMAGKILADYQNEKDGENDLYIWENTYVSNTSTGVNSFGQDQTYHDYTVGTVGWSGLGYACSKEASGKDLSMIDKSYYLHFAMRGTDADAPATHGISVGNSHFAIGTNVYVDGSTIYENLGNYERDGQWYSYDIPVSKLMELGSLGFTSTYKGNVLAILSGGTQGTNVQFDAVFFYKKANDVVEEDTEAPSTPVIAVKSTSDNAATLTFTSTDDSNGTITYIATIDGKTYQTTGRSGAKATLTVKNLAASTTYDVSVIAKDASGNTSESATSQFTTQAADTEAPTVPSVTVGTTTESTIELTLTSTDNSGATITYTITAGNQQFTTTGQSGQATTYVLTGLAADTEYAIQATAKDAKGNESAASAIVRAKTQPAQQGPSGESGSGVTTDGKLKFDYEIVQDGENVTITFTCTNPDEVVGLAGPWLWDDTNGFREVGVCPQTITYPIGTTIRVAAKWAYAGGQSNTDYIEYTLTDTSGIGGITTDGEGRQAIYTISGQPVKAAAKELPRGIYIVGGKKVVVK